MLKSRNMKVIAALLCIVFAVGMLTGCGGTKSTDTKDSSTAQKASTSAAATATTSGSGPEKTTLPIVSKPLTLKMFVELDSKAAASLKNLNDMLAWQEMEKKTGIHIDFIHPPAGQEKEQLNLIIASNDLPDMIYNSWKSMAGGPEKAVKDGTIIKLNELADKYAPNLTKIFKEDPAVKKDSVTDSGTLYMMPGMRYDKSQRLFDGFEIRKDWLDKLNMKLPTNIDEWYTVLKAFKEKDPNGNGKADEIPFISSQKVGDNLGLTFFMGAWGSYYGLYVDGGKVKYGPAEPSYKEYLETMSKWFKEGLIEPEYMVSNDRKAFDSKVVSHIAGSFYGQLNGYMGRYMGLMDGKDPKFNLSVTPFPAMKDGKSYNFSSQTAFAVKADGLAITSKCKNTMEAMKWIDLGYSEEGVRSISFGKEGVTYTMVNGKPKYTDLIMKNPDKLPFDQALAKYASASIVPRLFQDPVYWEQAMIYPSQKEAAKILASGDTSRCLPSVTPTAEESTKAARALNEINTYKDEMLNKFVMGQTSLDTFNTYIENVNKMGLKDLLDIYQKAYDRYQTRK